MSPKNQKLRCEHVRADGKRCAMPRAAKHDSLCLHHARRAEQLSDQVHRTPEAKALVAEILGSRKHFRTTTDVNDALGKLFSLRARKLISASDAHLLTYMSQLMLFSLHEVKSEFLDVHDFTGWKQLLRQVMSETEVAGAASLPSGKGAEVSSSSRPRKRRHRLPRTRKEFAEQVFARIDIDAATQEQIARQIAQHESQELEQSEEESTEQEEAPEYADPNAM
jgi:hypothetical protein